MASSERLPDWATLLIEAVEQPGILHAAYRRFWSYSFSNQQLALWQCTIRGIQLGPLNTFKGWRAIGRQVRKGEKAITLCTPISAGKKADRGRQSTPSEDVSEKAIIARRFVFRSLWFALSQTEGQEFVPPVLPGWNEDHAVSVLQIKRLPFVHLDGNCQGYAIGRTFAVSPIAAMPVRTCFHELAHIVLGHTTEQEMVINEHLPTPRHLKEVEAECVALILMASLNLGDTEFSRGYIQNWMKHAVEPATAIPDRSAQKIFHAADTLLKAGRITNAP